MVLNERLRQLVALLPDDSSINLPVRAVREWLDETKREPEFQSADVAVDLTVEDIAQRMGKAPSTVRGWFTDRRSPIQGAYKFHGKEWRVAARDFQAYLDLQRTTQVPEPRAREPGRRGLRLNDYKR